MKVQTVINSLALSSRSCSASAPTIICVGLAGTKEQTLAAANHYGVDVSATYKAKLPSSTYSMNHSAFTCFVGPEGTLRLMFRDGTSPQLMAQTIQKHLQK